MEFNATFLISAISFIVFVLIMKNIFYEPIEKIINERNALIDENSAVTKKNNSNSEKFIEQRAERLNNANLKGKNIMIEKSDVAKKEKIRLIVEAKKNSTDEVRANQSELKSICDNSVNELNSEVENLANSITQKLFGDKVNNEGIG